LAAHVVNPVEDQFGEKTVEVCKMTVQDALRNARFSSN
jgi:hypothetical protein